MAKLLPTKRAFPAAPRGANGSIPSDPSRSAPAATGLILLLAVAVCFSSTTSSPAQDVQHLSIAQPGGMPGLPVMTGIRRDTNGATVTWDGPLGYYQLYQKSDLLDAKWQAVGKATNLVRRAVVPAASSNAFFRVSGPSPNYAGARTCSICHGGKYASWSGTPHATALESLAQIHQDTNSSCLACHTVGYGLPTGFSSITNIISTNRLAGVQCENCHGPAANHAANEIDPTAWPRVELAATVCGGCHNGSQHPTFDEWRTSGHAQVVPDAQAVMSASTNNVSSCGRCHSGSARLSLVKSEPLPVGDTDVGIVCATCHDPHAQHAHTNVLSGVMVNPRTGVTVTNTALGSIYTNQLRYPYASTNDYYLSTSADFPTAYNPNINVCAQCHNHRGASWASSSRAPHHSPQYNMLLGTVGVLPSGMAPHQPATHSFLEQQCVTCHMQTRSAGDGQPAVTGHTFEVNSYDVCQQCHSNPQGLVQFVTDTISNRIQQVKLLLDLWAENNAPSSLWEKYDTRAWEYSTPGDLSPDGPGPDATEQAEIPDDIKKARFDLYLVLYDGSYGVHNGPYDIQLLDAATAFVSGQLYQ